MLEVEVWSYGNAIGSYVLTVDGIKWLGPQGDPFEGYGQTVDGVWTRRAILKTDDLKDGWITPEQGAEAWLRRLPGFLAMRGHMSAKIVDDT